MLPLNTFQFTKHCLQYFLGVVINFLKMNYQIQIEATKHKILLKNPNAQIQGVGSNNIVTGIWYTLPNYKQRFFRPLINCL
jgi:hypothetical protein